MNYTEDDVREALIRLTMCANRECAVCEHRYTPITIVPSPECKARISFNINLLTDKCFNNSTNEEVCL